MTEQIDIVSTNLSEGMIEVDWADQARHAYHAIWLRDNCRCEACGDPATGRRSLLLSEIELDCQPISLDYSATHIQLTWPDGHESRFASQWLRDYAYDKPARAARTFQPRLWDQAFRQDPPLFDYAELDDETQLLQALMQVRDRGLCLIRNAPAEAGIVEAFARRFGFPQESNFGRVQDLTIDRNKRSIANDVHALKPHTDEPYRASPPGILLFHCVTTDIKGSGCSTFLDGFEIAEVLRQQDAEGFAALTRNRQGFRRHFEGDVDVIAEFPSISLDDFGNIVGIRVNDRVAAPLQIDASEITVYYRGLRQLLQLSEDPARSLRLSLQPGDIAMFDNHRVLHGRSSLSLSAKRWLQWVQIERGDLHSSLRIIADRLGISRDTNPLLRGAYG